MQTKADYNPCNDCTADCNDYYTDENGDVRCCCDSCPYGNGIMPGDDAYEE